MKREYLTPISIAALIGVILWTHFNPRSTPGPPSPGPAPLAADARLLELGQAYAKAIAAAPLAGLDAGANKVDATSIRDFVQAQADARTDGQKAAYQAIGTAFADRFGALPAPGAKATPIDSATAAAVRAFYAGLAAGYRKGAGIK